MEQTEDYEVRIALSRSDRNKIWVTLGTPSGEEIQVGFNKQDVNQILQVDELFYDDMTEEEVGNPLIEDCRACLALACYYPQNFLPDLQGREVVSYLDDHPIVFVSPRHMERVFTEIPNTTQWKIYDLIRLPSAKSGRQTQAVATKGRRQAQPVEEIYEEEEEGEDIYDENDGVEYEEGVEEGEYDEEEGEVFEDGEEGDFTDEAEFSESDYDN